MEKLVTGTHSLCVIVQFKTIELIFNLSNVKTGEFGVTADVKNL
jgi:hypothetical protein